MKLTKFAYVALSAALVFGAKSAAASSEVVGTTFDHMKLQFNLTLASQNNDFNNGKAIIWSYSKVKLTNKDILDLLANMANTTWPAGAQLEYIFDAWRSGDYDNQLVVADRTGTNILFFAGDGVDNNFAYGWFDLDPFDTDGVYAGNETIQAPVGQEFYGEVYFADFEFYTEFFNDSVQVKVPSNTYIDLWGGGSTTETYGEKWTPTTDSGYDNMAIALVGGGYYNGNSQNFLTGSVLGSEQWSDFNQPKFAGVVKVGHKSAKH